MQLEIIIQITSCAVVIGLLLWLTPRQKVRDAQVIFLFKQFMTWFFGLLVVEWGLIEYPIRFFPNATKASFTFEYIVYPGICVFFNLYYPELKSKLHQFWHYSIFSSGITVFEVVLERNTMSVDYLNWSWYWTWITIFLTFLASRAYYCWFRKQLKHPVDDEATS